MKKLIVFLALIWGGGAAGFWYWNDHKTQEFSFRTVPVVRGDIQPSIRASGTIEPEDVVDVGAQVAGLVESFGPDLDDPSKSIGYGSRVEAGTVLTRLDSALYKARVEQSRASVTRSEADLEQARAKLRMTERDLDRLRRLVDRSQGMVAPQEFDAAQSALDQARAGVLVAESSIQVARANLKEAEVNLGYTEIRSPVRGVILDRRINIGQTVVASLNAPSLFLIAKDLKRMQIWASVNETDIGAIQVGQGVRFTVSSLPAETFHGAVAQVRLNASMMQNVVTYTVVVEFDNPDGRLLPYLTARLEFEREGRRDVLLVPNSALRWRPRPQYIAPESRELVDDDRARSTRAEDDRVTMAGRDGLLWVRDGDYVRPIRPVLGLSDGTVTEVSGPGIEADLAVVTGVDQRENRGSAFNILPHIQRKESPKESPQR